MGVVNLPTQGQRIEEAQAEITRLRQQVATLTEQRDALLRSADYRKAEKLISLLT